MLEQAKLGIEGTSYREDVKRRAIQHVTRWLTEPGFAAYHLQIGSMVTRGRWDLLVDSFYQVLPFGTGGRRGPVGVGPNRFNPWTLGASVQGHVAWLRTKYGANANLHVVIAYDVRRYLDAGGMYDGALPNPSFGLSSRDFAEFATGVYVANGVRVTLLPPGSTTYVSTPELSFAIRKLGASGGLNVSASHNPPDDNGGKFYNALGGQEVPPDDETMATLVDRVEHIATLTYANARATGRISDYAPEVHQAYLRANLDTLATKRRSARVVFTGLHGTGDTTVGEVLAAAGFPLLIEPTQAPHDGRFTEVPFRTPNPEVRQSMARAVALAEAEGYDLVMACDPDADRIGLCARESVGGPFRFFTGNELGALVAEFRLRHTRSRRPIVMKTEVTSELFSRIGRHHGAQVVDHLMVGFKYIGDALRELEATGRFGTIEGGIDDFVVGIEESHGVLVTPAIRDKDAAGAALALAEYASELAESGQTLTDALRSLWIREGYVHNELVSTVMRGATGRARIEAIQASIRAEAPAEIGGHAVTSVEDRLDPAGPLGPIRSGTDAASRDVIVIRLGPNRRIILRPSGTEPKNKIYVECVGTPGADLVTEVPRVAAEARSLALAFAQLSLGRVGLTLPLWALQVSDLVAVEQKQHFAEVLIPGVQSRLAARKPVSEWIDAELRAYGKDPRGLIADAVRAWAEVEGPGAAPVVAALLGA